MKQIINGKRYDTETAQELSEHWNGRGRSDFRNLTETLFKTKAGVYFLVGKGGALTEYARQVGDMKCNGERLIPMSPDQALEWLERHGEADVIEREFPDKIIDA
ncbi:MAG TPA: hypothetical protein VN673_02410 [Clostridia bacterium]|nr:hypothetical protein [Clostridia bacterium]